MHSIETVAVFQSGIGTLKHIKGKITLNENAVPKFHNTLKGLYLYNRLVFGVASAPALWQRAMDQVLQGCPGTQCYLDDIIVTGDSDSSHLENCVQDGTSVSFSKIPSRIVDTKLM